MYGIFPLEGERKPSNTFATSNVDPPRPPVELPAASTDSTNSPKSSVIQPLLFVNAEAEEVKVSSVFSQTPLHAIAVPSSLPRTPITPNIQKTANSNRGAPLSSFVAMLETPSTAAVFDHPATAVSKLTLGPVDVSLSKDKNDEHGQYETRINKVRLLK